MNDCPQTETLSGGEDEEGCEGSGQVRMIMFFFYHDVDQDLFDHDYVNHVHHHSDAPLDDCDDHDNNHDGEDEEGCEGSGQVRMILIVIMIIWMIIMIIL